LLNLSIFSKVAANETSSVNNSVYSICKACAKSNREYNYPIASLIPALKQFKAPIRIKQEGDASKSKKYIRKIEDTRKRNSLKAGEDALKSLVLTRKV
jgi:hypothetical protein